MAPGAKRDVKYDGKAVVTPRRMAPHRVLAALFLLGLTGADSPALIHVTITTTPAQTLQGWGMSLAWEANDIFGSPVQAAKLPDPAEQRRYMDLVFGDPASGPGLGLNIARYNIGGGDNPDRAHCKRSPKDDMLPDAQMEGFLDGPNERYDWSRDASQRHMLREAKLRGANLLEAFSNSPPWWMTVSGCVAGAEQASQDNLRADAVPAFAAYLSTVVDHFRREEGITFTSVSPFNEPDGSWWVVGNRQEGGYASLPLQQAVITALSRDLAGTGVQVSGTDTNNLDAMTGYLARMDAASLEALDRVNVHQYSNTSDPKLLRQRVTALGKPLWASEIGCCFSNDQSEMWGALYMAAAIQTALRDLGAEAWCFWQTDWGVIDVKSGHPVPLKQFYAIAQFTRFIRPGFTMLALQGDNTVAGLSPDRRRLVLATINRSGADEIADFDLTAFHRSGAAVAVYRTTADPAVNLAPAQVRIAADGHLVDHQPPSSVTTYVIDGEPAARPR